MSKRILLTGGAGFIGSHFVEAVLKTTDFDLTVIDRLTYAGNLNRWVDMDCWQKEGKRVKFVYHDFRSPLQDEVFTLANNPHPDYIIHMGAESHVDRSITDPLIFAESNVIGTINMLEFAKLAQPEKFIYVSTDEVYGAVQGMELHKEGEPYNPSNPYSASKAAAESFCLAFHKSYGLPVLISNTMNNFGERQSPEKFVPMTIKHILINHPVTLHCKKTEQGKLLDVSSRCWLHARDHASGLLFLLEHGNPGEKYNIVGERKTVTEVADFISEIMGIGYCGVYEDFHSFRPGHDMHYGQDGSKMAAMGWLPPCGYVESMTNTVKWMVENKHWLGLE